MFWFIVLLIQLVLDRVVSKRSPLNTRDARRKPLTNM
jgi:hypothetical protein